ncbi:MAG: hypothetical protein U0X93_03455 [Anaerolineales bacterium]
MPKVLVIRLVGFGDQTLKDGSLHRANYFVVFHHFIVHHANAHRLAISITISLTGVLSKTFPPASTILFVRL